MTTTGIKCPGCGEFHTEGHYLTCLCTHCQPPDDGPPTAVVPMVVMPRELAERCLFQAQARGTFLKSRAFGRAAERAENAAVQSDLQDLLARE